MGPRTARNCHMLQHLSNLSECVMVSIHAAAHTPLVSKKSDCKQIDYLGPRVFGGYVANCTWIPLTSPDHVQVQTLML